MVALERGLRVRQIAMTLGAQLSEQWHADDVVTLIARYGLAETASGLLPAGAAHSPLVYLKRVLHRALTSDNAIVSWHSPVRAAWIREQAAVYAAGAAARQAQLRADVDARDAAAAAATGTGRAVARAVAAAATGPARQRQVPGRLSARTDDQDELQGWPEPRQPGGGLPAWYGPGDGH